MNAALAVKPMPQLTVQYGPMRTVLHSDATTDTPREQADAYRFNILGGKGLRESVINDADGDAVVIIRCVEYIDPVTQQTRYGVDYWSTARYWATDHGARAIAEKAYEDAVRDEFARPTPGLCLSPKRFMGGLAHFFDVTDVI
ncbi:hypothetical protein ACFY1J_05535 [Streptomyces sp. NPDC001406]|uniref:hypothetical protein n=1 Tax=Streptomyces sp. NPDC001406 TaxID=3364572 RepID=UPI0036C4EFD1